MAYASAHHFEYCTTVLTLSRLKNSRVINEIALKVSQDYPQVHYFFSDFKKNKGIDLSIDLTNLYDMYRQDYCGCVTVIIKTANQPNDSLFLCVLCFLAFQPMTKTSIASISLTEVQDT